MSKGYLALILHAHLPYVRHPEHGGFLEEDWLFEAISECYIPMLSRLQRILADGVRCRLTLSISPTLLEMLSDPLLRARYQKYLESRVELSAKEVHRTKNSPQAELACMYYDSYRAAYRFFQEDYRQDLVKAFRELQELNAVELITCPATHPFMPFIAREEAQLVQLQLARRVSEVHFKKAPRGLWLAECGYAPQMDCLLSEAGFEYSVLDAHGLLFGTPRPTAGIFAPIKTPSGIIFFGRDLESGRQVWSSKGGYPGDIHYREFYRDVGYDAEYNYLLPYLHSDGIRRNVGLKYHRITGCADLSEKEFYDPHVAARRAEEHADDFIRNRCLQIQHLSTRLQMPPIVVSPYDAELFGHWWYEGPEFLEHMLLKAQAQRSELELLTLGEAVNAYPQPFEQKPSASSWGSSGYHEVWLNPKTQWIYPHQHQAEAAMVHMARQYGDADGVLQRALNQAARELLLAESSDWAFLISQGTSIAYAVQRFRTHIARFWELRRQVDGNSVDLQALQDIESQDRLFSDLDFRAFRRDSLNNRRTSPCHLEFQSH